MRTIGFLGGGNMAGAIIGGILREGILPPEAVGVYDVDAAKRARFAAQGLSAFGSEEALTRGSDVVVLAVKPQVFPQVLPKIKPAMTGDKLLVSIAAGISGPYIQEQMGFACRLVLAMPNTPLLVGEGAAALSRVEPATEADFAWVRQLFAAAGTAEEVEPGKLAGTIPIHGSAPAFLYLFAKTVVECAEREGIDPAVANRLFCQTLRGSAKMMEESGETHQALIDMVCSPGGTTLAALEAMEAAGFSDAVRAGYSACVRRARELSR